VDCQGVGAEVVRQPFQIALDRRERHAVPLELLDQRQSGQMRSPVAAHPARAELGRRQQSARAVEADGADGHAGARRQLVDGEDQVVGAGPFARARPPPHAGASAGVRAHWDSIAVSPVL
jgi:hypothetical protein